MQAHYCFSPAMSAAVHDALAPRSGGYDVLHVEHLRAALYGLQVQGVPRIYDAVDCMSRLLAQAASDAPTSATRLAARAELGRTQAFERRLLGAFDRVLVTAPSERDALRALHGTAPSAGPVTIIGNGVDLEYFAPAATPRDPATVVFVGRMGYHANVAAARELLTGIMPRVWARRPAARLLLVGTSPPRSLRMLAAGARGPVEITGYVSDIRPALARATVSVSPLRYAVGIQNKVLEAMAMGTPVVATPSACAALSAIHGEHLLVETHAERIATAVLRLFDDPALARRIGNAGRRYVAAEHDWRVVAATLEAVYRETIEQTAAQTRAAGAPAS
jgi:glycosyltransferase involved in cell wall biosynthesis